MNSNNETDFLKWALPNMGYQWNGFRKPRNQVLGRIRNRISELGLSGGFREYRDYLEDHPREWEHLNRLCDVTISKFFRDRKVWEYMRDDLLPDMFANRPVSIWSVGCCNGEEAYSLAIITERILSKVYRQPEEDAVEILATDRNSGVLERARKGRYPAGSLQELTKQEINKYFQRIDDESEDEYLVANRLKEFVEFENRDIQNSLPDRTFDLVLCRNLVFTYFTKERRLQFLERLKPLIRNEGYLVIGSNEHLPKTDWMKDKSETYRVFRRK